MTKLALYDKHEGPGDRMVNDYYRHDYIYRKNLGTRFAVGFGGLILLAFYLIQTILIEDTDVFELDFSGILIDSILFLAAILAVYSVIGTIQGTREYYLVQKRLEKYRELVTWLDNKEIVEEPIEKSDEEMYIPPTRVRQRPRIDRANTRTIPPPGSRTKTRTIPPPGSSSRIDDPRRQASRPRPTRPSTRTVRPPNSSPPVRIPRRNT